ncbi:hypothetical protein [Microbacterium deminutum]|uniref:hypothetical protein n=1 Tax=Microbacterium deminutum TaxID=344164 RepID=UPI0031DD5A83
MTSNSIIENCAQLPASVVRNAGLEPAYRHLDPRLSASDASFWLAMPDESGSHE